MCPSPRPIPRIARSSTSCWTNRASTPNPLPMSLLMTPTPIPARTVAQRRKTLRFTVIRPTPTGPPCTSRPSGATTCTPRCPRYATPMAIPKTSSASTCRPAPSPARPTTPWPSATASATVQRASVHYVDPVHCGRPARKPVADGSSASTPMKPPYNTPSSPERPRLAAGLPPPSPRRGTQDQPLHPPPLGRPKSPLPRTRPHPDRHPDPSQRHQPRTTGHPGPAPRSRGLGHRLTRPPTASSTSADEQHRTAQHHFWPTNHTGNPIQREHYISGVLEAGPVIAPEEVYSLESFPTRLLGSSLDWSYATVAQS